MVVFSAVISYLLAPKVKEYDWKSIILFFMGGMLVTGSANAINQVVEKDTDAMMKRTANRPVASGQNECSGRLGLCRHLRTGGNVCYPLAF